MGTATRQNLMTIQQLYSLTDKRVWVAGHNGMVGSALVRTLRRAVIVR